MTRNRLILSQPYLEFLIPALSFFVFLPILIFNGDFFPLSSSSLGQNEILVDILTSNFFLYLYCSICTAFFCWSLNQLIISHDLLQKTNFLPSLLALFYTTALIYSDNLTVGLAALPFVMLAISNMLKSTGETHRLKYLFNSGFFIGLALLIDHHLFFTLPVFLVTILIIRPIEFRGVVVFLLGNVNVLVLVYGFQVLMGEDFSLFSSQRIALQQTVPWDIFEIFLWSVFGLITILGFAYLSSNNRSKSNRVKLKVRVLLLSGISIQCFAMISQLFYKDQVSFLYVVPVVVYSGVVAYLSGVHKYIRWLLILSHFVLIGLVLYYLFVN